jgi:hypothetical protein
MSELYPESGRASATMTESRHVIGSYAGTETGTIVIAVGGIHGNEPAGVRAAETVLAGLHERRPRFRGQFTAIAGNMQALAGNQRFIVKDLNRQWTRARVAALASAADSAGFDPEDRELLGMWREIEVALGRSKGPAILLDLHTSSADGPPFATMGDTLCNRKFVQKLPLPVILGLEEQIDGALLEYVNNLGHITVGVEAGRHDRPASLAHHVAVLWLSLVAAGCMDASDVPDLEGHLATLDRATHDIPRIVEMRHRHVIRESDEFRMRPGFRSFDPVKKGDELAHDRKGAVRARETGVLLLPLYQAKGDDGFFMGREVRPFWLTLSSILRRMGVADLPHLLPGVRRDPREEGTLIVNTWIARFFPLEVFHLLGYRKRRRRGPYLIVSRRREEFEIAR